MGKLREVPGVFSQGETLEELEENIRDAYDLIVKEDLAPKRPGIQTKKSVLRSNEKISAYRDDCFGKLKALSKKGGAISGPAMSVYR